MQTATEERVTKRRPSADACRKMIELAQAYRREHAETNDPVLLAAARGLENAATEGAWRRLDRIAAGVIERSRR